MTMLSFACRLWPLGLLFGLGLCGTWNADPVNAGALHPGEGFVRDDQPGAAPVTVYDPNPQHLWNRLYQVLLEASDEAGAGDPDQLDPFVRRRHADRENKARANRALAILDEFIAKRGDKLISDPRKRAFLQRDLWAWFDELGLSRSLILEQKDRGPMDLARRLAVILPRLALSASEIQALPDNLAEAVAAKKFPEWIEAGRLWDAAGPWVLVGTEDGRPLARTHFEFFGGRSVFFVFLRYPEGRAMALKTLDLLRPGEKADRMPEGAYFALARRMQLIDERGLITTTPIIESLEVRGLGNHAFKLSRKDFLAGKAILARLEAEDTERSSIAFLGRNTGDGKAKVLSGCGSCHMRDTMESYARFFPPHQSLRPGVIASNRAEQESNQRSTKLLSYEWGLLQGLGR